MRTSKVQKFQNSSKKAAFAVIVALIAALTGFETQAGQKRDSQIYDLFIEQEDGSGIILPEIDIGRSSLDGNSGKPYHLVVNDVEIEFLASVPRKKKLRGIATLTIRAKALAGTAHDTCQQTEVHEAFIGTPTIREVVLQCPTLGLSPGLTIRAVRVQKPSPSLLSAPETSAELAPKSSILEHPRTSFEGSSERSTGSSAVILD